MPLRNRSLWVVLCLVSCGCSTPAMTIRSTHDQFVAFPDSGSFKWVPGPQDIPDDPRIDPKAVDKRVRTAVERGLATKGYKKATTGEPNFLVAYHVALASKLDSSKINEKYWSWGYGPDGKWSFGPNRQTSGSREPAYEKGSLILDIVAPEGNRLLWRGSAEAEVDLSASAAERERRVQEAVRRLLDKFKS